jgi:hypothetical protein
MEDRLLKRQQRGIKEMKRGSKDYRGEHKLMRRDTVDIRITNFMELSPS